MMASTIFPEFDATTMMASTILVWVRLTNLTLFFWHHKVLGRYWKYSDITKSEYIGNTLSKILKMDLEITEI